MVWSQHAHVSATVNILAAHFSKFVSYLMNPLSNSILPEAKLSMAVADKLTACGQLHRSNDSQQILYLDKSFTK
jgi:hypothetical protein